MLNVYEKQIAEYMSNNQIAIDFTKPTKSKNIVTFELNFGKKGLSDEFKDIYEVERFALGFNAKGEFFIIEDGIATPLDNSILTLYPFSAYLNSITDGIDNFLPNIARKKFVALARNENLNAFKNLSASEKNALIWAVKNSENLTLTLFSEYFKFNKNSGFWHDLNKATKGKSKDFLGSFFEKMPSDEDFEKYSRVIGNKLSKQVISVRDNPEITKLVDDTKKGLTKIFGANFNKVYGKDDDSKSNMPLIVGGAVVGGALLFLLMRKK